MYYLVTTIEVLALLKGGYSGNIKYEVGREGRSRTLQWIYQPENLECIFLLKDNEEVIVTIGESEKPEPDTLKALLVKFCMMPVVTLLTKLPSDCVLPHESKPFGNDVEAAKIAILLPVAA